MPAPSFGKLCSVASTSPPSLLRKSFITMSASASASFPAIAAHLFDGTSCKDFAATKWDFIKSLFIQTWWKFCLFVLEFVAFYKKWNKLELEFDWKFWWISAWNGWQHFRTGYKGVFPLHVLQFAVNFNHGCYEPLTLETIVSEASFVGQPFFVHFLIHNFSLVRPPIVGFSIKRFLYTYFVHSWKYPEDFTRSTRYYDVAANSIQNIDAVGSSGLPGSSDECVRFAGECTHGTEINYVARQFR